MIEYRMQPEPRRASDYIGTAIMAICTNLAKNSNFSGYSYKDEMIDRAIENCLHRSTKIATQEHGPVEIEKIVGQTVTVRARDGVWRKAAVHSYGSQELYRYKFGGFNARPAHISLEVIATKNHRWFIRDGSVTENLQIGDYLEPASFKDGLDPTGVIHGILFGDGGGHKRFQQTSDGMSIVPQGRQYSALRVCKQDVVRDEIVSYMEAAGYKAKYPPFSRGDPVFYVGKWPLVKNVPHTLDPSYIAGFIYGWWLADGSKSVTRKDPERFMIASIDKEAIDWLKEYASYGGYTVVGHVGENIRDETSAFPNAKPLYSITLRKGTPLRVRSIEYFGRDEVFCLQEPVTSGFVLGNGLLTGNCVYAISHFDPAKSNNPFGYFTMVAWRAFIHVINFEKTQQYLKHKNLQLGYDGAPTPDERSHKVIEDFESKLAKKKAKKKAKNVLPLD